MQRYVVNCLVDGRVIGYNAELPGQLQLGSLYDQALKHLTRQLVARRHIALARQLLLNAHQARLQFIVCDRCGVDDGNDKVSSAGRTLALRNHWPNAQAKAHDSQQRAQMQSLGG